MKLGTAQKAIEKSEAYKEFAKERPEAYLAHGFSMHDAGNDYEWQLGYYEPKRAKLVVFNANPVKREPEDEAFNKEKESIKKLDLSTVTLKAEEAEEKALQFQREKYPAERVSKVILILQHLDVQLYNFTFVTNTFKTLNVRVDAANGDILSHEIHSILDLRKE